MEETRETIIPPVAEEIQQEGEQTFKIPDEYASEPWAQVIKDEKTLWQNYAGAQKLIGKKSFEVPDFSTMDETKVNEYFQKLAPEKIEDYSFGEMQDESKKYFGDVFKNAGIAPLQASKLVDGFAKYEQSKMAELTSKSDYEARMQGLFGAEYEKAKQPIDTMLTSILSAEEMDLINKNMPNQLVEIMYKISKGVHDKYGYTEGDKLPKGDDGTMATTPDEKSKLHAQYNKELEEISKRAHTVQEKQVIIDKIVNLYK